jgi:small subunit ribosomal protein S7
MSRRNVPPKRESLPDARFNSVLVQQFVNRLMHSGKKSVATRCLYDAFDLIEARAKRAPLEVFEQAVRNTAPQVEVKPRRVGGATYQIPMEVPGARRQALAMRWLITAARQRAGKSMAEKLAGELLDAAAGQGSAIRKREEVHKNAEANRAFASYRW